MNNGVMDAAIAKAKAKAAAKRAAGVTENATGEAASKTAKVEKSATTKETDEASKAAAKKIADDERAAKKAARDAEREVNKAKREAERDERRAAKAETQSQKKAHMSKVDKAAERLPMLTKSSESFYNQATASLTTAELTAVAAHINHFNRAKATERALGAKLEVGDTVTITGGEPRYVGRTGTVVKAQRIRCFVAVEGVKKDIYLFTSDVEVVSQATRKAS